MAPPPNYPVPPPPPSRPRAAAGPRPPPALLPPFLPPAAAGPRPPPATAPPSVPRAARILHRREPPPGPSRAHCGAASVLPRAPSALTTCAPPPSTTCTSHSVRRVAAPAIWAPPPRQDPSWMSTTCPRPFFHIPLPGFFSSCVTASYPQGRRLERALCQHKRENAGVCVSDLM